MLTVRWFICALMVVWTASFAADAQAKQAVAAPTQPVSSNDLTPIAAQNNPPPVDGLEAIVNKNDDTRDNQLETIMNKYLVMTGDTKSSSAVADNGQKTKMMPPPNAAPPPRSVVQPVPEPAVVPGVVNVLADTIPEKEDKNLTIILTAIRVFAIRWHDVFDIAFFGVLVVFIGKLYLVSRDQYKTLARSVRIAEDAAAAARKSAAVAETLLKKYEEPDESQGNLDLR